jgi:hypothetical protein
VPHKLSLDALAVDSFEAGSHAFVADTLGRDCTSFPVCPRTDTTDSLALKAVEKAQSPAG